MRAAENLVSLVSKHRNVRVYVLLYTLSGNNTRCTGKHQRHGEWLHRRGWRRSSEWVERTRTCRGPATIAHLYPQYINWSRLKIAIALQYTFNSRALYSLKWQQQLQNCRFCGRSHLVKFFFLFLFLSSLRKDVHVWVCATNINYEWNNVITKIGRVRGRVCFRIVFVYCETPQYEEKIIVDFCFWRRATLLLNYMNVFLNIITTWCAGG